MFSSLGWGEVLVLVVVGLVVFGPERLPGVARDAGRLLRQLRQMASGVRDDLTSELGPEVADLDLRSLHPKAFVQKHLFGDDDDEQPAPTGNGSAPAPGRPSLDKPAPDAARAPRAGTPYDTDAT